MLQKIKSNPQTAFLWAMIICNTLFHLLFIKVPAFLDEMAMFSNTAEIAQHHFNPFIPMYGYKPPVIFMIPAFFYRLFGPTLIWPRIEIIFLSSVSLYYLYKLGERLFSRSVGLTSAFLFMVYPLFTVFGHVFEDSIPFTAFFLAALYYFFSQNTKGYLIATSLLVLTKEPGVFLPLLLILYTKIITIVDKKKYSISHISWLSLLIPVIIFIVWMILNKLILGWYLWPVNVAYYSIKNIFIVPLTLYELDILIIDNGMWIVFGIDLLGILWILTLASKAQKDKLRPLIFFLCVILIFSCFFMSGYYIKRYYLFLYPLVFLLFSEFLALLIKSAKLYKTCIGVVALTFVISQYFQIDFVKHSIFEQSSLAYLKEIKLIQKLTTRIQYNYATSFIIAPWYVSMPLSTTAYGFQTKVFRTEFSPACNEITEKMVQHWENIKKDYPTFLVVADKNFPLCSELKKLHFRESICLDPPLTTQSCYFLYTPDIIQ